MKQFFFETLPLVILMLFEIKLQTVPHSKGLTSGLEPSIGHGGAILQYMTLL